MSIAVFVLPIVCVSILQSLRHGGNDGVLEGDFFPNAPPQHSTGTSVGKDSAEQKIVSERFVRKTNDQLTPQHFIMAPAILTQRIFSNFTNNLARGVNLMTSISGCHIAAWIYFQSPTEIMTPDCGAKRSNSQVRWSHGTNSSPVPKKLRPYDTVYVHKRMVQPFVQGTLPFLKTPIILLTGSYENSRSFRIPKEYVQQILDSPFILHWFCTNIYETLGHRPLPPKLHPLALGVEPFGKNPKMHPHPVSLIRDTLLRYASLGRWDDLPNKTLGVFEPYISPYTNPNRVNMPQGTHMPLPEYLDHVAKSRFVLSPNGHKPDCFRHYEALGFGTVPITELDPAMYSHLQAGPVIFENRKWWNLTETQALKLLNTTMFPIVNRNLIFEEYWMEEMEQIVGHPLRWYDIKEDQRSRLQDFKLYFDEIPIMIKFAWANYSSNSSLMLQNYIGERSFRRKKKAIAAELLMRRNQDSPTSPPFIP